jgi:DNA-binding response OmpR family regulator
VKKPVVLIADPNTDVVHELKRAWGNDFDVVVAKDGSKALELSILKAPELILFDRACTLIGATQFVRILRANPRTEEIPVILMSDTPLASGTIPGFLQGVLVKPLNLDEVRAHLTAVVRKVDAVKQVGGQDGAVSGELEQISMPDLLQIFSLNRRTGSLQLTSATREAAEIFLSDGRIEEAAIADARGQKALFRLLTWRAGRFAFMPGRKAPSVSLSSSTDSLLMEGMRQADELARLAPELPPTTATLERLVPADALPEGLHPVTAEIVGLVEYYPRIGDLLDKAKATDLEVYLALRSLLTANLVRVSAAGEAQASGALLSPDELVELRSRLRRAGLAPTYYACPKVAVVVGDKAALKSAGQLLARLPGFKSADLESVARLGFGPLGALELDASMTVDFNALPADDRLLPLAYGLSAGTVAALVLGTYKPESLSRVLHLIEHERRATLLFARARGETAPELSPRRLDLELEEFGEAGVRDAVHKVLTQAAGREDLRGGTL